MANFSIKPSAAVPASRRVVNTAAQPLRTNSNPQGADPPFPILLADTVTIESGGEQTFRSDAFLNTTGRPIELHGMRFTGDVSWPGESAVQMNVAGLIGLQLSVDDVPLTQGAVPVWHLCRSDNRRVESDVANAQGVESCMAWYFSQPIPLMPGQSVQVRAQHYGVVPYTANVYLAFPGRISPTPLRRRYPFVSHWSSRAFNFGEAAQQSTPPAALVNTTGRDLVVDRIIGRSATFDDANNPGTWREFLDWTDSGSQGVVGLRVRLGLSMNRPILKTFTAWRAVFGTNAALETNFIMRAGDFVIADVKHVALSALTVPLTFSQTRGSLSIVGWREV